MLVAADIMLWQMYGLEEAVAEQDQLAEMLQYSIQVTAALELHTQLLEIWNIMVVVVVDQVRTTV
jgi:hypothetical protein